MEGFKTNDEFNLKALRIILSNKSLLEPIKITKATLAGITIAWQDTAISFSVRFRYRSSPSIIKSAIQELLSAAKENKKFPLLVIPNISKSSAELIEKEGISAIDLNGNYIIQTKALAAFRLDKKNSYKETQTIKNIYTGVSSIVSIFLLSNPIVFKSVSSVYEELTKRGALITLSTVSKVLKRLEDELIIEKTKDKIKVIQPDKLLENLKENYIPPIIIESLKLKLPGDTEAILSTIAKKLKKSIWTLSGVTSADTYAITTPANEYKIYATEVESLQGYENERFYNVQLLRINTPSVYFDRVISKDVPDVILASKIQTYLELANLGKREKEIAQNIKDEILKGFKRNGSK